MGGEKEPEGIDPVDWTSPGEYASSDLLGSPVQELVRFAGYAQGLMLDPVESMFTAYDAGAKSVFSLGSSSYQGQQYQSYSPSSVWKSNNSPSSRSYAIPQAAGLSSHRNCQQSLRSCSPSVPSVGSLSSTELGIRHTMLGTLDAPSHVPGKSDQQYSVSKSSKKGGSIPIQPEGSGFIS